MPSGDQLVDAFFAAHSAPIGERGPLLDAAVSDDAVFDGIQARLEGRAAILRDFTGDSRLVRTSPVQRRGRWLRWSWEYRTRDDEVATAADGSPYAGMAVAHLGDDGRLDLIVPFLDG